MASSGTTAALGDDAQATAATEELLRAMESYQPIIPDAVTLYYLGLSGYQCNDPRVTRVASLAAHKFVADLTNDALRYCKQLQQKGRPFSPPRTSRRARASTASISVSRCTLLMARAERSGRRLPGPQSLDTLVDTPVLLLLLGNTV